MKGQVIQSAMSKKMTLTLNLEKSSKRDKYCTVLSTRCQKKHTNTFNHFSFVRGTPRNLPSSAEATSHLSASATRLLGCENIHRNSPLLALANGRELLEDLLHPPLGSRNACSVCPWSSHTTQQLPKKMTLTLNLENCSKRDEYCPVFSTHCKKNTNTFNHFSVLRGTHRNLHSSAWATSHLAAAATPMLGCRHGRKHPKDPMTPGCSTSTVS